MCCVYDGLEPHSHYEPQQDTNNQIPIDNIKVDLSEISCESGSWSELIQNRFILVVLNERFLTSGTQLTQLG
jgi:hypothetical protein